MKAVRFHKHGGAEVLSFEEAKDPSAGYGEVLVGVKACSVNHLDIWVRNGLPGVIIHGALKNAFLAQLMTDWIGEDGTLKKLGIQYRGMDVPGDTLTCKGRVTKKYVQDGLHYVDCEIWLENGKGEKTTPGSATVVLPTKGGDST
jgi:hypothetical protein